MRASLKNSSGLMSVCICAFTFGVSPLTILWLDDFHGHWLELYPFVIAFLFALIGGYYAWKDARHGFVRPTGWYVGFWSTWIGTVVVFSMLGSFFDMFYQRIGDLPEKLELPVGAAEFIKSHLYLPLNFFEFLFHVGAIIILALMLFLYVVDYVTRKSNPKVS